MGPKGAVEILFRKEIAESDDPAAATDAKIDEYREKFANPYVAAGARLPRRHHRPARHAPAADRRARDAAHEARPQSAEEAREHPAVTHRQQPFAITIAIARSRPRTRMRSWRLDVHQGPDRQPRRDRAARHPRLPRAGRAHRGGLLRGRRARAARARGGRGGAARPRAVERELPAGRRDHRGREADRRRGDPSRLRLPLRARVVRARGARRGPRLHRAAGRGDRRDGQQDGRAHSSRSPPACRWCPAPPRRCATPTRRREVAEQFGYPGAAQGGGRRRREGDARRARARRSSPRRSTSAQREAKNAFGDDAVYVEKYIEGPRHVEIQVLGDQHGNMLHLGERECSVQRRHQKMIEEAPSVAVSPELRARMGAAAVAAAKAAGYVNAGTCEFLLDADGEFYFLEMNTRIQVEHPVTELVTGDRPRAVAAAHRRGREAAVHAGGARAARLGDRVPHHERGSGERLPAVHGARAATCTCRAGPGVRWDSGIETGSEIALFYDPMLAKLIVWAPTRAQAIARMHRALLELTIDGVDTSRDFHLRVMENDDFRRGAIEIQWLERHLAALDERRTADGGRDPRRDRRRAAGRAGSFGRRAARRVRRRPTGARRASGQRAGCGARAAGGAAMTRSAWRACEISSRRRRRRRRGPHRAACVVFVPRTAPGDVALRTPGGRQAGSRAASSSRSKRRRRMRVDPPCAHYTIDRCGGLPDPASRVRRAARGEGRASSATRCGASASARSTLPTVRAERRAVALPAQADAAPAARRERGWIAGLHPYDDPDAVFDLRDCPITDERVLAVVGASCAAPFDLLPDEPARCAWPCGSPSRARRWWCEGGSAWPTADHFFAPGRRRGGAVVAAGGGAPAAASLRATTGRAPGASFVQVNARVAARAARRTCWTVCGVTPRARRRRVRRARATPPSRSPAEGADRRWPSSSIATPWRAFAIGCAAPSSRHRRPRRGSPAPRRSPPTSCCSIRRAPASTPRVTAALERAGRAAARHPLRELRSGDAGARRRAHAALPGGVACAHTTCSRRPRTSRRCASSCRRPHEVRGEGG